MGVDNGRPFPEFANLGSDVAHLPLPVKTMELGINNSTSSSSQAIAVGPPSSGESCLVSTLASPFGVSTAETKRPTTPPGTTIR